jgi:hypothetical protein
MRRVDVQLLGAGTDSAAFRPRTLQGLLDRMDAADAARAAASIPFLLTIRWLGDALLTIGGGGEPDLRRLREHLTR